MARCSIKAGMHGAMGPHAMMIRQHGGATGQPTMPGQDAFGTIQEVVRILEADPATDWSKVTSWRCASISST
jgi:hypothetical protein